MADIFLGTSTTAFELPANWQSLAVPSPGEDLQYSANCILNGNDANVYGTELIDASRTFDIQTYNFNCGAATINGTLKIGTSAGTGLICASMTFNTGSARDWQDGSKITCSGNWTEQNASLGTAYKGTVVISGTCTITKPNTGNYFYSFQSDGALTLSGSCRLTRGSSILTVFNSTVNIGSNVLTIGVSATGIMTFGVSSDLIGSGQIYFSQISGCTLTNNRATAFSFTGTAKGLEGTGTNNIIFPAWDFSNGHVQISGGTAAGLNRYISAGTLKCKNFSCLADTTTPYNVLCNTYNPSFEISGDFTIDAYCTWTKGTGLITLTDGAANINFASQVIEDLIVNTTGTKTNQANFTTDSYIGTAGLFVDGGFTITVAGNIAIANSASLLTSTGQWTVSAAANISNP